MLDVAKYKAEINKLGETIYSDSPVDEIDSALEVLYCERKPLDIAPDSDLRSFVKM